MPRETPEPLSEPQTQKESPFLEHADELRTLLVPDEEKNPAQWKSLLQRLKELPDEPTKSPAGDVVQPELERQYRNLIRLREQAVDGLHAVLTLSREQKNFSLYRSAVLRSLAQYLDSRDVYQHVWAGTMPAGARLPEYLADYVRTHEREQVVLRTTETVLPMQYDVRDRMGLSGSPRTLAPLAHEISIGSVRKQLSYRYVLECIDASGAPTKDDAPYERLLTAVDYSEKTSEGVAAAKLLIGYLAKYRNGLEEYIRVHHGKDGGIEQVTIADALEYGIAASPLGKLVGELAVQLPELSRQKLPDILSFAKKTFEEADQYPERLVATAFAPLGELSENTTEQDRATHQRNVKAVLQFLMGYEAKNVSLRSIDMHAQHLNEAQKKILRNLRTHVSRTETADRLLKTVFIPADPSKQEPVDHQIDATLRSLVTEQKLSARDAFEIFYFTELKHGGNLTLLYKVAHILDSHGYPELAKEVQYRAASKLFDLAAGKAGDIDSLFGEYDLSDEQKRELGNIREYLKESGIDWVVHWWDSIVSFHRHFPKIALALDIVAVGGAIGAVTPVILTGRKLWITVKITQLEEFAGSGAEAAKKRFGLGSVPDAEIRAAQEEVTKLLGQYDRLGRRFHFFRGGKIIRNAKAIMGSVQTNQLRELARAYKSVYPQAEDVASKLAPFCDSESALRNVLTDAGYKPVDIERGVAKVADAFPLQKPISAAGSQTVRTVEQVAERAEFNQLKTQIDAAKKAGDDAALERLLRSQALQKAVDAGNEEAVAYAKAGYYAEKATAASKFPGKTLLGLCLAFDAYLIFSNEQAIASEKNAAKKEVLLAKRKSLVENGGAGVGMLFVAGGPVAGALMGIESTVSEMIYDDIMKREQSEKEWAKQDPISLKQELRSKPIGSTTISSRIGLDENLLGGIAEQLRNARSSEERLKAIEGVNRPARLSTFGGYMLKVSPLPQKPGESDDAYRDRVALGVLATQLYAHRLTRGTNDMSGYGVPFLEEAQDISELSDFLREHAEFNPVGINQSTFNREQLANYRTDLKPSLAIAMIDHAANILRETGASSQEIDARITEASRALITRDLAHRIVTAEEQIRNQTEWEEGRGKDRARLIVRRRLEQLVGECSRAAVQGHLTLVKYEELVGKAREILNTAAKPPKGADIGDLLQMDLPDDGRYANTLLELIARKRGK